jgi:4,5-dihydroxyphthalate decarboxylase
VTGSPLRLTAALGPYAHTAPLKDGRVTSPQVTFQHVEINPVNRAFRPMVNDLTYDVSELALVTHFLARTLDRPLRGLPVVLMRQSAHQMLTCRNDAPIRGPGDLAGRTIGVRAYTQTTGTWVRGILHDQFALDLSTLSWVTYEPAHVDGYADPPNCRRAADGQVLLDMLLKGEVDAAVGLEPHSDLRTVIPDVEAAEADYVRQSGVQPINHVLVLREDLAQNHPWLPSELFFLFQQARTRAISEDPHAQPAVYGLDANRAAIELLARYASEQGITPRTLRAEELFDPY